jgi:hypothetical protein
MVDEYLVEPRELEYLGYEEDVINRYNHLLIARLSMKMFQWTMRVQRV